MKIKKYEADTEQEAMIKIKEELGKDAVILSIKKIQPKGVFKLFNKPKVEVTAAYEENDINEAKKDTSYNDFENNLAFIRELNEARKEKTSEPEIQEKTSASNLTDEANGQIYQQQNSYKEVKEDMKYLEQKIDNLEILLNKVTEKVANTEKSILKRNNNLYENEALNNIYSNLLDNEVLPEVAEGLLDGMEELLKDNGGDVESVLKVVYNRIIDMMGDIKPVAINNKPEIIVMMGSTGVGKTTTIAKLSSYFILNEHKKVGLITADTYRIAAVEQLKVYADILGIEVAVVYCENEVKATIERFKDKDIIFVDTAGRSHKNNAQVNELSLLLEEMPDCQKYLILSAATKYKDAVNIIETYSKISDYNIIFTKVDETVTKGLILNICHLTGKPLSYITVGQNVPDDIELINPQEIAKELLRSMS